MNKPNVAEERELFRRALCEGLSRKYENELTQCPEPVPCSEACAGGMQAIIDAHAVAEKQKKLRRKLTALLLAAALLTLTACTVYAYRSEIRELLVRDQGTDLCLFYGGSPKSVDSMLEECYTFDYVPEGYEMTKTKQQTIVNSITWKNAEGKWIIFEQLFCDGASYVLDAEKGESAVLTLGTNQWKIYYRKTEIHTYIWNDGTYSFQLSAAEALSEEDLTQMLDGMRILEP